MYVRNSTAPLRHVLVCPPTYLKTAAPINEISKKYVNQPLDATKLQAEFKSLLDIYQQTNVAISELTPAPTIPNSIFSRDFGACVKEGYILGNFREPIRFEERAAYEHRMAELGIPKICEVKKGHFEGGDFAFLNEHTVAIGMLARTDPTGFDIIKSALTALNYQVFPVPANPDYLHLDMCFNLVDDHLAVAYPQGLPKPFLELLDQLNIKIIPVPETAIFAHGCNLESLGNHRVISLKQNRSVNEALRQNGMTVFELDTTETLKAGGGPHCMTFPLNRQ